MEDTLRIKILAEAQQALEALKGVNTGLDGIQKEAVKVGAIARKNKLNPTAVLQKGQVIELN